MRSLARGLALVGLRSVLLAALLVIILVGLDRAGKMTFFCQQRVEEVSAVCLSIQDLMRRSPVAPLGVIGEKCDPDNPTMTFACTARLASPLLHATYYLAVAIAYLLPTLILTLLLLLGGGAMRLYRVPKYILAGAGLLTLLLSTLPIFTLATLGSEIATIFEVEATVRHGLAAAVIVFADLLYRRCSEHVHAKASTFINSVPFRALETRGADPWRNGWRTLLTESLASMVPQLPLYVGALTVAEVVLRAPGSLGQAVYLGYLEYRDLGFVVAAVLVLGVFWSISRQVSEWLERKISIRTEEVL